MGLILFDIVVANLVKVIFVVRFDGEIVALKVENFRTRGIHGMHQGSHFIF